MSQPAEPTVEINPSEAIDPPEEMKPSFVDALSALINRYSMENGSDTPDFILAQMLCEFMTAFERAIKRRSEWYKDNDSLNTSVNEDGEIEIRDVYSGVMFVTNDDERLGVCMRDGGFEISTDRPNMADGERVWYSIQRGIVTPMVTLSANLEADDARDGGGI